MPEQSVYLSFQLVFYASLFFGTIPLKLIKSSSSCHFIQTWPCKIYSCLCLLLMLFHFVLTPYLVKGESKTSSTLVHTDPPTGNVSDYISFIRNQTSVQMVAMRMMNPLVDSFMSLGALIVGIIFVRRDLPHFFNKLSHVDVSLSKAISHSKRLDFKISLSVILYFCVLSFPGAVVDLFYTIYFALPFWDLLVLVLDNFISFSSEIQFMALALYLLARFKVINNYLGEHEEQHISTNYFSIYKNIIPFKSQLTLQKIEILHYSNKKLCELMKDLNRIYQFQLLCSAAGCFIKVLLNIYFAMFGSKNQLQAARIVLWSMYYLIRFLAATITASLTSNEAMKTKCLVTHINSRHLSKDMQEELNLFYNHILSTDMEFTACGLLTVNTRLITAALATGTTYLVVLVQFRPQI